MAIKKYRLHWTCHPLKNGEWYEEEKKRRTPDEVAKELDISYLSSVTGRVFTSFRYHRHVSEKPIPFNPHSPVYRIWDFGRTNAVIYGQMDSHGRKTLLHERILTESSTPEQIPVAKVDSRRLFPGASFVDICDPAGSFQDHRGSSSDVEQLRAEGIYPQYQTILSLPTKDRKSRGRKYIEQDLQSSPGGKDAFQIYVSPNRSEGCPIIAEAFEGGYSYKRDIGGNYTDVIDEAHPFEDVIDCLIYWYLETHTGGSQQVSEFLDKFKTDNSDFDIYLE